MNKEQLIQQLRQEGLWAKKGLGQNFLVDEEALDKIVEAAELSKDDTVLEIGPGLGVLTAELIQRVKRVVAVELDQKLAGLLNGQIVKLLRSENDNETMKQFNNDKLSVLNADALQIDINDVVGEEPYKLVANIPYYITGKIIEKYLTAENRPSLIVLLVQKEVAERICAKPGKLSVLAISVQLYGDPEIVGIVPGSSFFPVPKVDSAILKIRTRHPQNQFTEGAQKELFKYIKMGFGSKRRTLVNNLSGGLHVSKETTETILKDLNLNPMARAQELSLENWISLVEKLKELK